MQDRKRREVRFFHTIELQHLQYSRLIANPKFAADSDLKRAYEWMAEQVGFWPLWLAVGDERCAYVTGYQLNWQRWIGTNQYVRKGEFPNLVCFVFLPDAISEERVYSDYMYWHCPMTSVLSGTQPKKQEVSWTFKPNWDEIRWHRFALRNQEQVQAVVPDLDLAKACEVWVRNKATQRKVLAMGFQNVIVKRIKV